MGTERYTKTQIEIGTHSKIYVHFLCVKSLCFSTLTPLPLIITEIMGTPAKPSGESLTPFQSLNGQISGYPLPRVSISFFPFTAHLQSYGIVGPGFRKKGVVSES